MPRLRVMHSRLLGREHYFLLVVDDYTRYTTVLPLRSKGQVVDVLIPWIRAVRLQLRERYRADLPVLRLQSDTGGEFSSDLLKAFCRGEGILQSFTLPDSPQQNWIAERRIGLVIEVARTSMIHAAVPHFLWPFAVRYAAHQLNLWPRCLLAEDLAYTALDGGGWRCVGVPGLGFSFTTPPRAVSSPLRTSSLTSRFPFTGPAPSGVSQVDPLPGTVPVEVAGDSGAARGAASGGAEPGGVEPGGVVPGGAESEGAESGDAEPGGDESEGVEFGGAESRGAASSGGTTRASLRLSPQLEPLSPQQLREWLVQRARFRSGAGGAGATGDAGAGGAGVTAGVGDTRGTATTGPGGARTRGTRAARIGGVGGAGTGDPPEPGAAEPGGAGAGGTGAGAGGAGAGGSSTGAAGARGAGAVDPEAGGTGERREPASRPVLSVRTARHVPHSRSPPVPGTHAMALCPSSVPLRVPLPPPPESSLPAVPDPGSDLVRAACPTVSRLLATIVTDPCFESAVASALVAELLDFAAACRLDFTTALVAEPESASPPSVKG
ncbi:unnamed protein product [Closterium sp. NIES-53]